MENEHIIVDVNSLFINEKYLNILQDVQRRVGRVLGEIALEAASGSSEQLDSFMISILSNDGNHASILSRRTLFAAGEKGVINLSNKKRIIDEKNKEKHNRSIENEPIKKYYNVKIAKLPFKEKKNICRNMLVIRADVAAQIKLMCNAKYINDDYNEALRQFAPNFSMPFYYDLLTTRNEYSGHDNLEVIKKLDANEILTLLKQQKKSVNIFSNIKDQTLVSKVRELNSYIDKEIRKIKYKPLEVEFLKQELKEFDFDEEALVGNLGYDYDEYNKVLYFHDINEVRIVAKSRYEFNKSKEALLAAEETNAQLEDTLSAAAEILTSGLSAVEREPVTTEASVEDDKLETVEDNDFAIGRYFPAMMTYINGHLTEKQLQELINNTTIMATSDCWLNKNMRKYIAYDLQDYMRRAGKRIVVDWNTRVELFGFEKNLSGDTNDQLIREAKSAHHAIHLMARHGMAVYLEDNHKMYSSAESIVDLAREYHDKVFTVLCTKHFAEYIVDQCVENIIPIMILPTGKCSVWSVAIDNMQRFFAGTKDDLMEVAEDELIDAANQIDKEDNASQEEKDTLVEDDGLKIEHQRIIMPVDYLPGENDEVYDKDGNAIELGKEIGSGGEGRIIQTKDGKMVAKIFHKESITEFRYKKIKLMISKGNKVSKLCWPEKMLFNGKKQFVGYLMSFAEGYDEFGKTIMKINSPVIQKRMQGWDRLSMVHLCIELCKTFDALQSQDILVGDINPRNFMLKIENKNFKDFRIVDCDSFQVGGYPCPVGTMLYTSPKIYKRNNADINSLDFSKVLRTKEDENYAIASMIFQILMLNVSPFAGKQTSEIEKALLSYNFAYRLKDDKENTGADTPDGPPRLIWNNMPANVKELFGKVFKYAENVEPKEWVVVLKDYARGIGNNVFTREIIPKNYWDNKNNERTKYFNCASCGEYRNTPKSRYEYEEERNLPHLCADCTQTKYRISKNYLTKSCQKCGRDFQVTQWAQWLADNGYRKNKTICDDCLQERNIMCGRCGRMTTAKAYFIREMNSKGKDVWCSDCQKEVGSRKGNR